jgi:pimeloyl-ACP methyl ester carboxylesterase
VTPGRERCGEHPAAEGLARPRAESPRSCRGGPARAPEGDVDLYIQRGAFEPAFATGLSAELQTEFYAKQRPITFAAVGATAAPDQAWERLPSWYVAGRTDGSIPLDLQLRMTGRAGSNVTEVQAGHLSMVSHPCEVAEVIKEAARATGQ